eukprot:5806672-Pyramimonas_sp.AAC.1
MATCKWANKRHHQGMLEDAVHLLLVDLRREAIAACLKTKIPRNVQRGVERSRYGLCRARCPHAR